MLARTAIRSARVARVRTPLIRQVRLQSTTTTTTAGTQAEAGQFFTSRGLAAGFAGGTITFLGGYAWYHFSGAKTLVAAAKTGKSYLDSAKAKLAESTPDSPNEVLEWLRQTATSYAAFIPGSKGYIDSAFKDLDTVRQKHGDQVDELVSDAYHELKDLSKKGDMDIPTAQKAWAIIQKYMAEIADLASDAMSEILDNHPEVKEKLGSNVDQLKSMGDKLGPEAKKQVEDTWKQLKDIFKAGTGAGAIAKARQLIEQKVGELKKLGDEAWKKGMKEAQPYFDKAPEAKKLIEDNVDTLKKGNLAELWEKVKQAASSGDTSDLEKYVKNKAEQAKKKGGPALDKYINMIPGGDQIIPKLTQLSEIAQKHGDEAQKIAKETYDEIAEVLKKKTEEAQKVADKAKKEAK